MDQFNVMKNIRIQEEHYNISIKNEIMYNYSSKMFKEFIRFCQKYTIYHMEKNIYTNNHGLEVYCSAIADYRSYTKILYIPGFMNGNNELKIDYFLESIFDSLLKAIDKFYNNLYKKYILFCKKNNLPIRYKLHI